MLMRVAINGMGRIGRAAMKIILEHSELKLVAVNDMVPLDTLAYLLRYDTVYGRYERKVETESDKLLIDGEEYISLQEKNLINCPGRIWILI
jgi:glyceraldehyde 3-phosphate dehydrogenase